MPFSWIKPEVVIATTISIVGMMSTVALSWSASNIKAALSDQTVASLQADVKEIKQSVAPLPLQAMRLEQLEKFQVSATGMFGAIDGRLRTVENSVERNTSDIGNIRSASGAKLIK